MIVDTSVLVAVITEEEDGAKYAKVLSDAENLRISAATYVEAAIVLDRRDNPAAGAVLDEVIADLNIVIEPFTRRAGAHRPPGLPRLRAKAADTPANLNFGDCFSYALARDKREPILFKGDDFSQTDLRPRSHNQSEPCSLPALQLINYPRGLSDTGERVP